MRRILEVFGFLCFAIWAQSQTVVKQTTKPKYTVSDEGGEMRISTSRVQAVVSKQTGRVRFLDAQGNSIVSEARDGKSFAPYRVPDREIGVDIGRVTENQRNALSWHMAFDLQKDEALYGLGQHQSQSARIPLDPKWLCRLTAL